MRRLLKLWCRFKKHKAQVMWPLYQSGAYTVGRQCSNCGDILLDKS